MRSSPCCRELANQSAIYAAGWGACRGAARRIRPSHSPKAASTICSTSTVNAGHAQSPARQAGQVLGRRCVSDEFHRAPRRLLVSTRMVYRQRRQGFLLCAFPVMRHRHYDDGHEHELPRPSAKWCRQRRVHARAVAPAPAGRTVLSPAINLHLLRKPSIAGPLAQRIGAHLQDAGGTYSRLE